MNDIVKRIKSVEWEAVAGLIAAATALVLHFLHIIELGVLVMITLVLLSLLFIRDLRRDRQVEEIISTVRSTERLATELSRTVPSQSIELVGPENLREVSANYGRNAEGEMIWFHVCLLMFRPQKLFDILLKPAVENPEVDEIQFVLDESERDAWMEHVEPKLERCDGKEKVAEPIWSEIDESISFILYETDMGRSEGLLSFWGEPFMARTPEKDVPRYTFRVYEESDLLPRFREIARNHRFTADS